MAIRKIVFEGDDLLRKKSKRVDEFGERLWELLDDMNETLKDERGAGLAAPQVGVLKRAVIVDVEEGFFELINPVILAFEGNEKGVEGCLSIKNRQGYVVRPSYVKVSFLDRFGSRRELEARGFFARAVCHEIDHLDGILYTDKATELWTG